MRRPFLLSSVALGRRSGVGDEGEMEDGGRMG
jgi:hypothetical protein